ncbi:MAG: DUF4132 domain-containing protein [Flavobacteriales bacterium]|nr:DUF4132 domain-containing protein [Flavobacteriales bacterium]
MLDKLRDALSGGTQNKPTGARDVPDQVPGEFDETLRAILREDRANGSRWTYKPNKTNSYAEVAQWPNGRRIELISVLVRRIHGYHSGRITYSTGDEEYQLVQLMTTMVSSLLRATLVIGDDEAAHLLEVFARHGTWGRPDLLSWPIGLFIAQIERQHKDKPPSSALRATLTALHTRLMQDPTVRSKEKRKLAERVSTLLIGKDAAALKPVILKDSDPFSALVNGSIAALPEDQRGAWYAILTHAMKANGAKPAEKFLDQARTLVDDVGVAAFKAQVTAWFDTVVQLKERTQTYTQQYNGREYTYTVSEFLGSESMDVLKGLAWMCSHFHDARTLDTLAALAERSFRKIPGKGPAAAATGNAAIYALYRSRGLDGIGHLSRLKLRIKQSSTVALIDRYLSEAAASKGISVHEIEDLACDDLGLKDGSRTWEFDGYKAMLVVTGPGKSDLAWFKPDGTPQKSLPTVVKTSHAARLKKMKDVVKRVDQGTMAQRDRLDRMFRSARTMSMPYFREHFVENGLLGVLAKGLIWNFQVDSMRTPAILVSGTWITVEESSFDPTDAATVSLWHPASASVAEVRAWRDLILAREIRQPLKQAYREVYLITDAELRTRTYSNRMAAHLLRQHQFNSLAKTRGWRYALQGAFDNGFTGQGASVALPDYGLTAHFWLPEVNADDAYNDTGIWTYVATDQVRFCPDGQDDPMDLADVPPVAFSEVMRDVDLFVGVASVGNDPEWRDSGGALPGYRDYWQSYSFGDLGEVAKTRKEILSTLIPRLKIARVASIQDKFLIVRGKLRTYKIHLGSTNILMEPNDQYLCIVADRSKTATQNVFLPFEGDNGLSVIISKAFLLADDDKITDPTITSQINRQ